jgi:hypothetical protein
MPSPYSRFKIRDASAGSRAGLFSSRRKRVFRSIVHLARSPDCYTPHSVSARNRERLQMDSLQLALPFHDSFVAPTPKCTLMTDDPRSILAFAVQGYERHGASALVTRVEITGGAARSVGAQMAAFVASYLAAVPK